jgi:PHP family Zn ribbon phosphoesterase
MVIIADISVDTGSYAAKNDKVPVVAILMKTGLNNVVWPTLFTVSDNIEQYCYTRFRINNIVQYCLKCEQCGPHNIVQSC